MLSGVSAGFVLVWVFGWLVWGVGGLVGFVWFCSRSNFTSVLNLSASEIKHIVRIKNLFTEIIEWLRLEETS